jgi:hypothetical protein
LKLSGAAYCWGSNNLGELGAPNFETCIGLFGGKCSTRPPIPITVTGSGLFSVLAINGASSASADIVFFDDFP